MGTKKVKEGTSRGDTTTNLRNFSSRIFLVPAEKFETPILERLGRHDNLFEKVNKYEKRLEMDPHLTFRAVNQGFWISKVLWIQWDLSGPQKLLYKIQNRPKIQWVQPASVTVPRALFVNAALSIFAVYWMLL